MQTFFRIIRLPLARLVLPVLVALLGLADLAAAYEILVVQSRRDAAFEEVLGGFRSLRPGSERVVVLSEFAESDLVRIVREDRPALVVAVGDSALAAVRKIRTTPVISLMALGLHTSFGTHSANLGGISMFAPAEQYLALFQGMKKRRVGVLYHPARSGWYLRLARQAAQRMNIELVLREVSQPRQTLSQLESLRGAVDALWMIPDTAAVTRETVEAYMRFSQEQHVPVVSFAGAYLRMGAAAALDLDRADLGRQAAEMALAILRGSDMADLPLGLPRKTTLRTNPTVLRNLDISPENLDRALPRE